MAVHSVFGTVPMRVALFRRRITGKTKVVDNPVVFFEEVLQKTAFQLSQFRITAIQAIAFVINSLLLPLQCTQPADTTAFDVLRNQTS